MTTKTQVKSKTENGSAPKGVDLSSKELGELRNYMEDVFALQQKNRNNVRQTTAAQRIKKLKRLREKIEKYSDRIYEALRKDFNKSEAEVDMTEILPTVSEINFAIKHLNSWMRPVKVDASTTLLGSQSEIRYEPMGVNLIVGPWNYPFYLMVCPLVSAIAAGNTAILKPSEYTYHTAQVIEDLISETFSENEVAVIQGDAKVSGELLKLPFDHIFFTGSPNVGKIVMEAASKHLTKVTLELGGKSPVIVDDSSDPAFVAKKLVWGKYLNVGQTCIAPDYALVPRSFIPTLVGHLKNTLREFYGTNPENWNTNGDYARIVNSSHHTRLKRLFQSAMAEGANVEIGGTFIDDDNFVSPTVMTNVSLNCDLMLEEIFGPILPIVAYDTLEEALKLVNEKEKPLALYIYSKNNSFIEKVLNNTSSGGAAINDNVLHIGNPNLPFGGVNNSGLGSYHGIFGFKAFSHERAVLRQNTVMAPVQFFYPPYTERVKQMIKASIKWLV